MHRLIQAEAPQPVAQPTGLGIVHGEMADGHQGQGRESVALEARRSESRPTIGLTKTALTVFN
jgi:hypothetical protein